MSDNQPRAAAEAQTPRTRNADSNAAPAREHGSRNS